MDESKSLRFRCHVNTNTDGDNFVGVKADMDDASIFFPLGYELPENDDDLRADVFNLFGVLATCMREESVIDDSKIEVPKIQNFPLHAYLKLIRHFLRVGHYYIETDYHYRSDIKGKISWSRTIREQRALIQQDGSLIFTKMSIRSITPNANKQITQIHRFCVYEAFERMGWLYVPFMPEKPDSHPDIKESIYVLNKKLATTNDDVNQELFTAMRDMLIYIDARSSDKHFFYGTEFFSSVWERMIDKAFGVEDKEQYFPSTRWFLNYGREKVKRPLQPDTIMIYRNKYYVLDAKLYRYGWDANPVNLPNSADINKQITYGEYIEQSKKISNEELYNAFIMPFNKSNNSFSISSNIGNIGEAVSDWKSNIKNYERIQGIVIDTRYLMYNYMITSEEQKRIMAECIEKVTT